MIDASKHVALLSAAGAPMLVALVFAPALFAPFLVPKFAVLEIAASLGVIAFALASLQNRPVRLARLLLLGGGLVLVTTLLSLASALHAGRGAVYAADAFARWLSLLGLALGASVLADEGDDRQRVLEAITVAAGTVAALGLLQHIGHLPFAIPVISTPGSTFGNRNVAAEFVAMALPIGVATARCASSRVAARGMYVAIGVGLAFLAATRARGAWIGGAAGLACTLVTMRVVWSKRTRAAAAVVVLVACVVAAVPGHWNAHDAGDDKRYSGVAVVLEGAVDVEAPALRTRLGMWRRTLRMIEDVPWLGVGPGNWPVLFPRYAEPDAAQDGVLTATLAPRQAHDDLLERTAETGLVGVGALLVLGVGVWAAVRRRLQEADEGTRVAAAGAAGALVALVVTGIAGFPLEMPGTLTLAAVALGLLAPDPDGTPLTRSKGAALLAAFVGVVALTVSIVRFEHKNASHRFLAIAERALRHDHGDAGAREALPALDRAREADPKLFLVELRTAQMWLRENRPADASAAATRALALEPYSPNAWAVLAAASLAGGDLDGAKAAATAALDILHDYPHALFVRDQADAELHDLPSAASDFKKLTDLSKHAVDRDTRRAASDFLRELR